MVRPRASKHKVKVKLKPKAIIVVAVFMLSGTILAYQLVSAHEGKQYIAGPIQQKVPNVENRPRPIHETAPAKATDSSTPTPKAPKPAAELVTSEQPQTTSVLTDTVSTKPAPDIYQVNEQFSGSNLNTSQWQVMTRPPGYRNNEEEDYSPSQVKVADGTLRITATKDANGSWHSGEVDSKWNYTYGEFEVRLKLSATGPGVWPAAWLMGGSDTWPYCGEIDIFEGINGDGYAYGTIHGGGSPNAWLLQKGVPNIDVTQYHTYKLIKQPNDISWWVDGVRQAEWGPAQLPAGGIWPFENHSNLAILNLAIGGTWPGPSNTSTPNSITMYVDYYTVKNAS